MSPLDTPWDSVRGARVRGLCGSARLSNAACGFPARSDLFRLLLRTGAPCGRGTDQSDDMLDPGPRGLRPTVGAARLCPLSTGGRILQEWSTPADHESTGCFTHSLYLASAAQVAMLPIPRNSARRVQSPREGWMWERSACIPEPFVLCTKTHRGFLNTAMYKE